MCRHVYVCSIYLLPIILYTLHICYLYIHCLYTTYITRLQIDRHYLCTTYICTTYILPHSTCVPLIWMRQLLYIHIYSPNSRCNSLPTRTHTTGTPTGGGNLEPGREIYIYTCYINIYSITIYDNYSYVY